MDSWLSLERALENIAQSLLLSVQKVIPLDYQFPSLPSEYGYTSGYKSKHSARLAIKSSRDAFQALIAHVTWGAVLHRSRALQMRALEIRQKGGKLDWDILEQADLDSGWQSLLLDRYNTHPAWVNVIMHSPLCDFSVPRAGLIIRKPQDWVFSNLLPALVLSNVPIWMIWGPVDIPLESVIWPDSLKRLYGPISREKHDAKVRNTLAVPDNQQESCASAGAIETPPYERHGAKKKVRFTVSTPERDQESSECADVIDSCPQPTCQLPQSLGPNRIDDFPSKVHTNIQSKDNSTDNGRGHTDTIQGSSESPVGLDIHVWIRQRELEADDYISRASTRERARLQQRQRSASASQYPSNGGATVYEWTRDGQGYLVRRLIDRGDVQQTWLLYGQRQRWFNYARNEWELCQELDPSELPENSDLDYTESSTPIEETSCSFDQSLLYRTGKLADSRSCDINLHLTDPKFLAEVNCQPQPSNTTFIDDVAYDAMTLLSMRFGYSVDRRSTYSTVAKPQWSLVKALRVIGDRRDRQTLSIPDGQEAAVIQFLMHLDDVGHPHSDTAEIPSCLCDLYLDNVNHLAISSSPFYIQRADADGLPLYIIQDALNNESNWLLAVVDPCTALQAIRSEVSTITEFALSLIRERTPFFTLMRNEPGPALGTTPKPVNYKKRRIGLGERPIGHKLDKHDYSVYEAELRSLLDNRRVARAAVKRGGLLSKLALDYVDECEILRGPTFSEHDKSFRLTVNSGGKSVSFYDDDLSDEEISVLVGLYSIKSGKASHARESKQN